MRILSEIKTIKRAFQARHLSKPALKKLLCSCGISTVGIKDRSLPAKHAHSKEYCISVGIERPLPAGVSLPKTFQGVKVFVEVVGQARALARTAK